MEENRPLFVLKHWISDIQPAYALITERQYYLSHPLDSLQVVIGWLAQTHTRLAAAEGRKVGQSCRDRPAGNGRPGMRKEGGMCKSRQLKG